jgi:ankyrin repeat protein
VKEINARTVAAMEMITSVDQLMNYVETLLDLIHNRQWAKLEEVAEQRSLFKKISQLIQQSEEFNGMTLLHAVIKYNPPIQVLESMMQAHSDAIKGQDCLRRTPLHVACGTGSDSSIIRLLVRAYPEACDVQDVDGRTPLHLACDYECVLFEGDQTPRSPPTIDVVRALLSGSLKPVLIEDGDGLPPITYAFVSNASISVIKLLQKSSTTARRQISKINKHIAAESCSSSAPVQPILTRSFLGYC